VILLTLVVLASLVGLVVFAGVSIARLRRRGGSTAAAALAAVTLALGLVSLVSAAGHLGVALALDTSSNCDDSQQCEDDLRSALDDTSLRSTAAVLLAVSAAATCSLIWWDTARSGWKLGVRPGALAAGLVGAAVLLGVVVGALGLSLPHADDVASVRPEIRRQVQAGALGMLGFVVGSIAATSVARASRFDGAAVPAPETPRA
jgi:hypothetical protein